MLPILLNLSKNHLLILTYLIHVILVNKTNIHGIVNELGIKLLIKRAWNANSSRSPRVIEDLAATNQEVILEKLREVSRPV